MKSEGFILYEHVGNERFTHFRNRTAKTLEVTIARIHDLTRNQRFTGSRVFSIWNALTPVQKVVVSKNSEGKLDFTHKAYLLPAEIVKVTLPNGNKVVMNNVIGYEQDYAKATSYRRKMTYGGRTGDLTNWIKSDKREKPVPLVHIDKRNYQLSEKTIERRFGR
jgi:hypothetical protein